MQFEASLSSLFFPIPILFELKLGLPVRARARVSHVQIVLEKE